MLTDTRTDRPSYRDARTRVGGKQKICIKCAYQQMRGKRNPDQTNVFACVDCVAPPETMNSIPAVAVRHMTYIQTPINLTIGDDAPRSRR